MKRLLIACAMLLSSMLAAAQSKTLSGKIIYTRNVSLDFSDTKDVEIPESILQMLPKNVSDDYVLYYKPSVSYFQKYTDKNKREPSPVSSNVTIITDNGEDSKVYTDFSSKTVIQQKSNMGKLFLIEDRIADTKWKMSGRQKKILGRNCMEAISIQEKDTIRAWYTTEIPVSVGPETINGLPGAIMECSIGKQLTFTASSIDTEVTGIDQYLVKPAKGKKVTNEQYLKAVTERLNLTEGQRQSVIIRQY